jgi:hypothetical protein
LSDFTDIEDLKDIIFLVGVQELGKGYQTFSKNEKIDVMHIGVCRLLSIYGYYSYSGVDNEGWPHWDVIAPLPHLNEQEKDLLLKKAIIEYFNKS